MLERREEAISSVIREASEGVTAMLHTRAVPPFLRGVVLAALSTILLTAQPRTARALSTLSSSLPAWSSTRVVPVCWANFGPAIRTDLVQGMPEHERWRNFMLGQMQSLTSLTRLSVEYRNGCSFDWEPGVVRLRVGPGPYSATTPGPNGAVEIYIGTDAGTPGFWESYLIRHEFLPVLGFQHEHSRPDRPPGYCADRGTVASQYASTPFDADSITSYCGSNRLTRWDIVGLRRAYGVRSNALVSEIGNAISWAQSELVTWMEGFYPLLRNDRPPATRSGTTETSLSGRALIEGGYVMYAREPAIAWEKGRPERVLDLPPNTPGAPPEGAPLVWTRHTPLAMWQRAWVRGGPIRGLANLCIDIPGESTSNGTPLHLWECNWRWNQQWKFVAHADASLEIQSNSPYTLCMDVPGGMATPGARVQSWQCHGGPQQRFRLGPEGQIRYGALCLAASISETPDGLRDGLPLVLQICGTSGGPVAHPYRQEQSFEGQRWMHTSWVSFANLAGCLVDPSATVLWSGQQSLVSVRACESGGVRKLFDVYW